MYKIIGSQTKKPVAFAWDYKFIAQYALALNIEEKFYRYKVETL